jgi:purine-binding chemotaxis protein CheW
MDELELELKTTFLGQADQLMAEAETCFLELESSPGDKSILDRIFRVIHNLKGSSNAVGFEQIGDFCHVFENLLLKLKNGQIKVNEQMVDLLLKSNDFIGEMVVSLRSDMQAKFQITPLKSQIESAIASNGFPDAPIANQPQTAAGKAVPTSNTVAPPVKEPVAAQVSNVVPLVNALRAHDEVAPVQKAPEKHIGSSTPTGYKISVGERFLCFTLGAQEYGIPLSAVKQVIGVPEFTPIPEAPSYFVGITNLRGKVIATLDLAKKFSIANKPTSDRATIILNSGSQNIGVIVDSVNHVVTPDHKDLSPRPDCDPNVRTEYIISVYRRDGVMILLIDIANALGIADWDLIRSRGLTDKAA